MLSRTALTFTWSAASAFPEPPHAVNATATASRLRMRCLCPTGLTLHGAGFHESPDLELCFEQGTTRVAQRLGRRGIGGGNLHVLRYDDTLQTGHVTEELADLVVVADHRDLVLVG